MSSQPRASLVFKAGWRHLRGFGLQLVLAIVGIAVGVAVVVGIDLTNESASRAFAMSTDALMGRATHQVVGGPQGVPESVYPWLRVEQGLRDAAPVLELSVAVGERELTLLGIDPFAEDGVRGGLGEGEFDIGRLIAQAGAVVLPDDLAAELEAGYGDRLQLSAAGAVHTVEVVGTVASQPGAESLLWADIATAQELAGRVGWLTRIDLVLEPDQARWLEAELPEGLELIDAGSRRQSLGEMSRAFEINLTALSLLALLVGLFLVYNTMSFALLRRRELIGVLRALGVERSQLLRNVLLEALILGGVGTLLGIAVGIPLANGLLQLVGRTLSDLYYARSIAELSVAPLSLVKAVALGMGGTLLAALVPAYAAASTPPRQDLGRSALERGVKRRLGLVTGLGAVLLILGALLLLPSDALWLGFVALFAITVGLALLVPIATVGFMRALARPLGRRFGGFGRMAARGVVAGLSRTGVALTALAVAVSAVVGMGLMIGSFRASVGDWLGSVLRADYYLARQDDAPLTPDLIDTVRQLPGLSDVSLSRYERLPQEEGDVSLWIVQLGEEAWAGFQFRAGEPNAAWQAFQNGAVIVTEPFAFHHALAPGDRLSLRTQEGVREFPVAGVYADYSSDRGIVAMAESTYEKWFGASPVESMGLYAHNAARLGQALDELKAEHPQLQIRSNLDLRERSMEVFDQTFAVTDVLRILAALVAVVGVFSALSALALERAREAAVLRALGFTPTRLAILHVTESGLMGLAAGLFALPLGIVLAVVLIEVINRRAFGWTMDFALLPGPLLDGFWLALLSAFVAAVYPAWRQARAVPARGLREE